MNQIDSNLVLSKKISLSDIINVKANFPDLQNSAKNLYISSISFRPDGKKLAISINNHVLLYDFLHQNLQFNDQFSAPAGTNVTTINWSTDGKQLAFGATVDNQGNKRAPVIINEISPTDMNLYKGKLKFHHDDAISCLAYKPNPTGNQHDILITCASYDYSVWNSSTSNVQKSQVNSGITSCSWHDSGEYLAFGFQSGKISIRNGNTEDLKELYRFDRFKGSILKLAFRPVSNSDLSEKQKTTPQHPSLAVIDFNKKLNLVDLKGNNLWNTDITLNSTSTFLSWQDSEIILTGDMDGDLKLYAGSNGALIKNLYQFENWIVSGDLIGQTTYLKILKSSGAAVGGQSNRGSAGMKGLVGNENLDSLGKSKQSLISLVSLIDKTGNLVLLQSRITPKNAMFKNYVAYCENLTTVTVQDLRFWGLIQGPAG